MAKFTVISGNVKHEGKFHGIGAEVDIDPKVAAAVNLKGNFLELSDVREAKAKAEADAKKAIAKAEKEAAAKLAAEADAKKGGAK